MNLSEEQKKIFQESGILHLKKALRPNDVSIVQQAILSELERLKLKVGSKLSSSKINDLPLFQQTGRLGQMVKVESQLTPLFRHDVIVAAVRSLVSNNCPALSIHPQLLLSFPHKAEWSLAKLNWHLDITVPKQNVLAGVQAFVLIDDVQTRGGATLAIAGSHQLHYLPQAQGGNAHKLLRDDPLFTQLYSGDSVDAEKLAKPHNIHGVDVSVIEMAGKAGDVFFMDMRVLHAPSVNATKKIRMMATNRFI
ncbi:phytanoyl-CoA dioxygenase family protein [Bdellovibrio bacteriovorus]|uniref:phytanoyl-CoA dioxygenase family protein n=1 Tax=Bdellovibrio bacteriovorus TaxID=959 RepID=UPI0035A67E3B